MLNTFIATTTVIMVWLFIITILKIYVFPLLNSLGRYLRKKFPYLNRFNRK